MVPKDANCAKDANGTNGVSKFLVMSRKRQEILKWNQTGVLNELSEAGMCAAKNDNGTKGAYLGKNVTVIILGTAGKR